MQHSEASPGNALWGLWTFFTLATFGFFTFVIGAYVEETTPTLVGAATMAFATLLYLFIHFWSTTNAHYANPTPRPAPRSIPSIPVIPTRRDGNGQANFDHLLSHTLERVVPPQANPAFDEAQEIPATASEQRLVAVGATPTGATPGRHQKDVIVPAVKRRSEWIGGMPILKDVLGEAAPVTSAARPGKTRGQCSGCNTILWAPAERPIRLRCPTCSKVAWLEA